MIRLSSDLRRVLPLFLLGLLLGLLVVQEAALAQARANEEQIEVTEWILNTSNEHVELVGRVRNISLEPLTDVVIFASLMDSRGNSYGGGQILLVPATLGSGESASFKTESWKRSITPWDTERNVPDIARVNFRFRTTGGKWLNGKYNSMPGSSGGSSQLEALNSQAEERYAERRRQDIADQQRSKKHLPAWWGQYDSVMAPLRKVESALRSAYREEGHPGAVGKEIRALRVPLVAVAQNLTPAPDPEVQAMVGNLLLSLAGAIEKAEGGANVGFREDYARAVSLIKQLDARKRRTAAASPP